MRKLGYIAIVLLAGLFVVSCQKEDIKPNSDTMVIPEWGDSMDRSSEDEDIIIPDDGDVDPDIIVDPNNDGDGREH